MLARKLGKERSDAGKRDKKYDMILLYHASLQLSVDQLDICRHQGTFGVHRRVS